MIIRLIDDNIKPGTIVPKPKGSTEFIVKSIWDQRRRGEGALIYTIPNRKDPSRVYLKGITKTEFIRAYQELETTGYFTRQWFINNLTGCSREGDCNFTTIGGIFDLIGLAKYENETKGAYKWK